MYQIAAKPLSLIKCSGLMSREDFAKGASLESLVSSLLSTGFQATNVGLAIKEINRMVRIPGTILSQIATSILSIT